MLLLILGLVLFLGLHSVRVFAEGWRTATIARIGAGPWKGLYSVLSILGFALLVYGYGQARQQMPLWDPPTWSKHITALLMVPVFAMFVAAYVPGNGIQRVLRHPQILSVKLWAVAHLLSNGNAADVLLFGSFLAWAIIDFRAARRRQVTGAAQVTAQRGEGVKTAICIVAGLVVYAVFVMGAHAWLIGVRPF